MLFCYAILALNIMLFKAKIDALFVSLILVVLTLSFDWPLDSLSELHAFFCYFIAFSLFLATSRLNVTDMGVLHVSIIALLLSIIFINWMNILFRGTSATNFTQDAVFIYLSYDLMIRFLQKISLSKHFILSVFSFVNLWVIYVLNPELQLRSVSVYLLVFLVINTASMVRFDRWYKLFKLSTIWGTLLALLFSVPLAFSFFRDYQPGSMDDRMAIFVAILDLFKQDPIYLLRGGSFGLGVGDLLRFDITHLRSGLCGDKCFYNSHSGFTTMLLDIGIIVLFLYLSALLYVAISSVKSNLNPERRIELIAIKVMLVLIFVVMNAFGNFAMGFTTLSDLSFFITFLGMLSINNSSIRAPCDQQLTPGKNK